MGETGIVAVNLNINISTTQEYLNNYSEYCLIIEVIFIIRM